MKRELKKKWIAGLLAAAFLLTLPGLSAFAEDPPAAETELTEALEDETAPAGTQEEEPVGETGEAASDAFKPGDVSGDGAVTAEDARLALRIAVSLDTYEESSPALAAADVDGKPGVSAADARLILRAAVGLPLVPDADHVHSYTATVVEPTCTEEGYTEYVCACGDSYRDDVTPPAHHYYRYKCTVCGKTDPAHIKLPVQEGFETALYNTAHPLFYKTADELPSSGTLLEYAYHRVGKWCCYYTIHDVFRPALQAAGYSEDRIEQLAPRYYPAEKIAKALRNSTKLNLYVPSVLASFMMSGSVPVYVPSLLLDYYINHPGYATTYLFREFYDDMVEQKIYQPTENRTEYTPRVGDILFMSNKEETYVNGYPTVDHTAQIIMMYADGSFWCTEGSIIQTDEEDRKPRVRERVYYFNNDRGSYEYLYNPIVQVLAIAQPDLYNELGR